ncbi:hypothetical protein ACFYKX_12985 [Cytobacillus sp. FJAT-54145]|uniref:Uncharacterized protein n=1 Tax=Cytobacillus spartinae TaxID=3299023 RepID=A0ABW6KD57_9BACI
MYPIKIDIGIFPQSYVSDEPESGGYFPFAIDGEISYLYDVSFVERKDEKDVEAFVSAWMRELDQFPIFSFLNASIFIKKKLKMSVS